MPSSVGFSVGSLLLLLFWSRNEIKVILNLIQTLLNNLSQRFLMKTSGAETFRNGSGHVGYVDEYNPRIHLWAHIVGEQVLKEKWVGVFERPKNLTYMFIRSKSE